MVNSRRRTARLADADMGGAREREEWLIADVSDLTDPNMRAFNTVTFDADGKQVATRGRTTVNYHEADPEDLPDEPPPGWPSDDE